MWKHQSFSHQCRVMWKHQSFSHQCRVTWKHQSFSHQCRVTWKHQSFSHQCRVTWKHQSFSQQAEEKRLKELGAEFYRTNRGGLITFHGPGQLVAYPILNLRQFHPSIKRYIATLQSTIINTCRRLGVETYTNEHTGVWTKDRKIAAIGKSWVLTSLRHWFRQSLSWGEPVQLTG